MLNFDFGFGRFLDFMVNNKHYIFLSNYFESHGKVIFVRELMELHRQLSITNQ